MMISQEDIFLARKSLFRAVEQQGCDDDDNNEDDDDGNDNDGNNKSNSLYSIKYILLLFQKKNSNNNNALRPNLSSRREHCKIILDTIQYNFDKRHARRFFSGLNNLFSYIVKSNIKSFQIIITKQKKKLNY